MVTRACSVFMHCGQLHDAFIPCLIAFAYCLLVIYKSSLEFPSPISPVSCPLIRYDVLSPPHMCEKKDDEG